MLKPAISDECRELIHILINDVDNCIIDEWRSQPHARERLAVQFDVLEKVRERLIVRLDG